MLHILCPKCNHSLQISRKQLKKKRYNVTCSECKLQFKADTIVNKQAVPKTQKALLPEEKLPEISTLIKARTQTSKEPEALKEPLVETYSWQVTKPVHHPARWLTGIILGIFLFAYQVYYFKGYALSQSPQIRPWLHIISSKLNYPLPVFRNLADFTTIGSSFKRVNADNYHVQISIINHADFDQYLPNVFISLHNLYGGTLAQRTFTPQQYLDRETAALLIKSSATHDIDFFISVPEQEVGGYSIELK